MKVRTHVHVRSEDGRQSAVLAPGDTVPDWATVSNPAAIEPGTESKAAAPKKDEESADEAPKRRQSRKAADAD